MTARALLLTALLLPGCGVVAASAIERRSQDEPSASLVASGGPPELGEAAPTLVVYRGEIRDLVTLRREGAAVVELRSDDGGDGPTVELDGRGGFAVRVEWCREPASGLERGLEAIVFPWPSSTCRRWIGRVVVRARAGSRCSPPLDLQGVAPARGDPLVLWLSDCSGRERSGPRWPPGG